MRMAEGAERRDHQRQEHTYHLDSGIPFTCECHLVSVCVYLCVHVSTPSVGESPLYLELSVTQHKMRITPDGCAGDARAVVRRFEVPMEGCNLPFSIN